MSVSDERPRFGALTDVRLREAWAHEALQFTPWLAANLSLLGNQLGMPLELEGVEVSVDEFSADILARNPLDDTRVLIENQLECSDHGHLGQILTYLAGVQAQTVVWVAREFREAHLAAINWLNAHTEEPYSFFAVRVRVVRIGDSPLAPIFEVLARPNHWQRQVGSAAREAAPRSVLGDFREAFWKEFLPRYPTEERDGTPSRSSNRNRRFQSLALVLSRYVSANGVGIFVRVESAEVTQQCHAMLASHGRRLEEELGAHLGEPQARYWFSRSMSGDPKDPSARLAMFQWLHEMTERYTRVLGGLVPSEG